MKRKPSSAKKGSPKTGSAGKPSELFLWTETFAGYSMVKNSGDFIDFQKQYYYTQNPSFSISGKFPDQFAPQLGASLHFGTSLRNPIIKFVSAGLAFSWTRRKLVHDVIFTNLSYAYPNKITISETFEASYLGAEFQLRFGGKVYGLLGIRHEALVSGMRQRTMMLEGDSVQNGKTSAITEKWNLKKSDLIRPGSLGPHIALGYNPLPAIGLRLGWMKSGSFFTSGPNLVSSQYYLSICFNYLK